MTRTKGYIANYYLLGHLSAQLLSRRWPESFITSPLYTEAGKVCSTPLQSRSQFTARTPCPAFLHFFFLSRGDKDEGGGHRRGCRYFPLQSHPCLHDASQSSSIQSKICWSPNFILLRLKSAPKPMQGTLFHSRCHHRQHPEFFEAVRALSYMPDQPHTHSHHPPPYKLPCI